MTLPVSGTNRHGHGDIALSWEQDFDWNGGAAAAAGHEWSQDDWEENVGAAAAAANNLYHYMEERNAAAAADENHDHGDAYRWNGADWNDEE
jgi:hypothetical protein